MQCLTVPLSGTFLGLLYACSQTSAMITLIIDCLDLCTFFFVYYYDTVATLYLVSNLYHLLVDYFHLARCSFQG